MPKLSKTDRGEAMPEKEDRSEDQLKYAYDIIVPNCILALRRDQFSVLPSLKTIINFDQMIKADPRGSDCPPLRSPRQATTMLRI